ncbi:acyltransferase family protein [Polaribacter sp.]|nr:acyltransferase family protein [Polaribacter sp.]
MKENVNRLDWIDLLRFVSIISVVIIHSQGGFYGSLLGSETWWIFNVINSSTHFSVPVFVMISGALLLKNEINLNSFLKRRFARILYPFLFWSFILFLGNIFLDRPLSQNHVITSFISDFLNHKINYVYWYVYMLVGLYLIAPIISIWTINCKRNNIEYFLLIWIFTLFTKSLPFLETSFNLSYFSGFIGYFILGHYLSTQKINKNIMFSILLIFIGLFITVLGNYFYPGNEFEDYLSPNIMILSSGVFLLFKNFRLPKNIIIKKLILKISRYSFGIYLIHAVFISILDRFFEINSLTISPYLGSFIVSFLSILFSIIFLEFFKRLPFTKLISGI